MTPTTTLSAGFSDPVFQSQAAFRTLLCALSEPGTLRHVPADIVPPEGLGLAAASALLTLADYETPIWLPCALRDGAAGAWLRFHCGATLVEDPAAASFAVIDGAAALPRLADFNPGSDQFPDRSTTVIVACAGLDGGPRVALDGPGIAGPHSIAPTGLRAGFWREVAANGAAYPLGVDLLLTHGGTVLGLPRSTRIEEA